MTAFTDPTVMINYGTMIDDCRSANSCIWANNSVGGYKTAVGHVSANCNT